MATVRVRAVANVMGLRRGDEGDVETGSPQVDAMLDRGYLEILEYLPDLTPAPAAGGWVEPAPAIEEVDPLEQALAEMVVETEEWEDGTADPG